MVKKSFCIKSHSCLEWIFLNLRTKGFSGIFLQLLPYCHPTFIVNISRHLTLSVIG